MEIKQADVSRSIYDTWVRIRYYKPFAEGDCYLQRLFDVSTSPPCFYGPKIPLFHFTQAVFRFRGRSHASYP